VPFDGGIVLIDVVNEGAEEHRHRRPVLRPDGALSLPGDPARAEWIAETFFETPRFS